MKSVSHVDLDRFMGRWYVLANIPTRIERGAHNAVESYELQDDGTIRTTFTFRKDSFDAPEKAFHARALRRCRGQTPDRPAATMPFGSTASLIVSCRRSSAWLLYEYAAITSS